MTRRRLPNRRAHESREILFRGQRFSIGVGRDIRDAIAEVFVDGRKTGSEYSSLARDAGIVLSIALQSGADLSIIRRALTRDHGGEPGSILGAIADALDVADLDGPPT